MGTRMGESRFDWIKEYILYGVVILLSVFAVAVTVLYYITIVLLFTPIGWILLIWWLWYA